MQRHGYYSHIYRFSRKIFSNVRSTASTRTPMLQRDDNGTLLTCVTFLGDSSHIAVGSHAGDLKVFDSNSNNVLESFISHLSPLTLVQSYISALSTEVSRREIFLYNVQTCQVESTLSDAVLNSTVRGHVYSLVHFSPSDSMLLWNGVLWDRRQSAPVHRFDPAGNEVIINSEVWDLRKFRLLRIVPSLDQTAITFNARGDVIYAILRSVP